MLPHKQILLLKTIDAMFLAARSDVSQPRRLTSKANEPTFRGWRVFFSDINVEELIGIVDKAKI
jgi:hypothetical protein